MNHRRYRQCRNICCECRDHQRKFPSRNVSKASQRNLPQVALVIQEPEVKLGMQIRRKCVCCKRTDPLVLDTATRPDDMGINKRWDSKNLGATTQECRILTFQPVRERMSLERTGGEKTKRGVGDPSR